MSNDKKWWATRNPVTTIQSNDGWTFDGTNQIPNYAFFVCPGVFLFSMTVEQIAILVSLENQGKLIDERYETWQDFCIAHNL